MLMANSAYSSEPAEVADDPIVRWERPEPDPDAAPLAVVPVFVPGRRPAEEHEAAADDPGEPGLDVSWQYQPIKEAPPPAPKGQWWAGWLPDPRGRHEVR